jgi:dUTP pyrophosphatase
MSTSFTLSFKGEKGKTIAFDLDITHLNTESSHISEADCEKAEIGFAELIAKLMRNRFVKPSLRYKAPYELIYAHDGDSGMDLKSNESNYRLTPGSKVIFSTGVFIEIPKGFECQIRPKSGLSSNGLYVAFGTVDNGYRGELKVTAINLNDTDIVINKGDKIAQLVLVPIHQAELVQVEEIEVNTQRGIDGHGSTGK